MLNRIKTLVFKELLANWRDINVRLLLFVVPVIQIFLFSYAATYDVNNMAIAIFDEDRTELSRELVSRFEKAQTFTRVIHIEHDGAIAEALDNGRARIAVHIGRDFSGKILSGQTASVRYVLDGRKSNTAALLGNYATVIISGFSSDVAQRLGIPAMPARIVVRALFNPNYISQWFIVPGLVCLMAMIMGLLVTALSIAREREIGTFDQLLVTPLRSFEIMIGKTIPALIISLVEATLMLVVALVWFRIPFLGSLPMFYGCLLIFLLSIIGWGLFISSLCNTQQQALLGLFLFMAPAMILSGFATPVENMPHAIQVLTNVNPIRHFLVITHGIFLKDMPFSVVWTHLWPIMLIGACTLAIATAMFRKKVA